MTKAEKHEHQRRKLWCDTAIQIARAPGGHTSEVCAKWADRVLKDFDKRFPAPVPTMNTNIRLPRRKLS